MEAQVSLTVAFSSSALFGLLFLIFLLTISHRFSMGSGLVSQAHQHHGNLTSFFSNECLRLTLLVKGVNDCLLDNYQISSLPHNCVA